MIEIKERISRMIESNRVHHAFLMVGSGADANKQKKETILFLMSQIFASTQDQTQEEITRRIEKKYHPDVFEMDDQDQEIKLDQVQEMIRWIYRAPVEAKQKFVIIHAAHRLNRNASNALLKTLEEPPAHATLILCAPSKDQLLQTLQSRMLTMQFSQTSQKPQLEVEPAWMDEMMQLVYREQFHAKEVFDLTQQMTKQRGDLYAFFAWIQRHLADKIRFATHPHHAHLYHDLFQQTLSLEQQIYHRYGNINLQLDRFFVSWGQRVR